MTASAQKLYLLALCGAADRSLAELGDRTPLEAAQTPALDELAQHGALGSISVIDGGICPESDSGIMALLGYDTHRHYTGRGVLEALGMGFMQPGENAVGCRINFASYDSAREQLDRRTARDLADGELQQLVSAVRDAEPLRGIDAEASIVGFGRHRGVICLRSERELSAEVSNTDPGFRRVGPFGVPVQDPEPRPLPCVPLDDSDAASFTAEVINQFADSAAAVLEQHGLNRERSSQGRYPANRILFRDAGRTTPSLARFTERFERTLALYGHAPSEHGLCQLLGGSWHDARQPEGISEADYYLGLLDALLGDPADVVVARLKGADEPGHDGQPHAKLAAIERLDQLFFAPLLDATGRSSLIVTCDHATPCEMRIHSADPVPALICDGVVRREPQRFCERDAATGTLEVSQAHLLLDHVLGGSRRLGRELV